MDGIVEPYVAATESVPPLPDCRSSFTVYVFAFHFAYSFVTEVSFQFFALAPEAV